MYREELWQQRISWMGTMLCGAILLAVPFMFKKAKAGTFSPQEEQQIYIQAVVLFFVALAGLAGCYGLRKEKPWATKLLLLVLALVAAGLIYLFVDMVQGVLRGLAYPLRTSILGLLSQLSNFLMTNILMMWMLLLLARYLIYLWKGIKTWKPANLLLGWTGIFVSWTWLAVATNHILALVARELSFWQTTSPGDFALGVGGIRMYGFLAYGVWYCAIFVGACVLFVGAFLTVVKRSGGARLGKGASWALCFLVCLGGLLFIPWFVTYAPTFLIFPDRALLFIEGLTIFALLGAGMYWLGDAFSYLELFPQPSRRN